MPHFFVVFMILILFSVSSLTTFTQNLEIGFALKCVVEISLATDIILLHLNIPMGERELGRYI
jgi:hypothetical protein